MSTRPKIFGRYLMENKISKDMIIIKDEKNLLERVLKIIDTEIILKDLTTKIKLTPDIFKNPLYNKNYLSSLDNVSGEDLRDYFNIEDPLLSEGHTVFAIEHCIYGDPLIGCYMSVFATRPGGIVSFFHRFSIDGVWSKWYKKFDTNYDYTFVVSDDTTLEYWMHKHEGFDFSKVLIIPGIYTYNGGHSSTDEIALDLIKIGTYEIRGEPESEILIKYNTDKSITGVKSLPDRLLKHEYITGLNITVENEIGETYGLQSVKNLVRTFVQTISRTKGSISYNECFNTEDTRGSVYNSLERDETGGYLSRFNTVLY